MAQMEVLFKIIDPKVLTGHAYACYSRGAAAPARWPAMDVCLARHEPLNGWLSKLWSLFGSLL